MGATILDVVENTPKVHNMIVCTLCSCYPRGVLGLPPSWYKSREYRARAVRGPRAVLAEFGTHLPDTVEVGEHVSSAYLGCLVFPIAPAGTANMDQEQLAALATPACVTGLSLP